MKKTTSQIFLFTLGIILAGAIGVSAFTEPTAPPTGGNTEAPINIGNADQAKAGGLSINAFNARSNALFMQDASFLGTVRGGLPTDNTSTVTIGGDAAVTGSVTAKDYFNSQTLVHPGAEKPVCSDNNGNIILCDRYIYVRISTVSTDTNPTTDTCNGRPVSLARNWVTEKASFYSDPGGTVPLDVAGMNFKLRQNVYDSNDTPSVAENGIASGTSFTYDGHSYYQSLTDQYGSSSCDIQSNYGGMETLDGSALAVPYTIIP